MTYPRWKFHRTHPPKVIHSAAEEHPEWRDSPPEAWVGDEPKPEKPMELGPPVWVGNADAPGLQGDEQLDPPLKEPAADIPLVEPKKPVKPPVKKFVTGNSLIT